MKRFHLLFPFFTDYIQLIFFFFAFWDKRKKTIFFYAIAIIIYIRFSNNIDVVYNIILKPIYIYIKFTL